MRRAANLTHVSAPAPKPRFSFRHAAGLIAFLIVVGFAFGWGNREPQAHYDYTFRIARALLKGELGLREPVSWLNELVPYNGWYYSVFPFGSVVTQIPAALWQNARHLTDYPAREVGAFLGVGTAIFAVALSKRYNDALLRRGFFITWFLFGSWLFPNVVMGSAWQVALGFAVLGEMGALTFTLHEKKPLLAGFFFAVAFGNRTEIILLAPVFIYLLVRHDPHRDKPDSPDANAPILARLRREWTAAALFCVFPFLLGVATLWYNVARFGNPLDFGYTRIPGVLDEYWYKPGLYSWEAILMNVREMLCTSAWFARTSYPYLLPEQLGGSLLSVCPFLLFLVRPGQRDVILRRVCWLAITLLLAAILPHGNAGGLRFSYRYALPLLPWIWFLLLDRRGGKKDTSESEITSWEWILFGIGVFANLWAVYVWFWTGSMNG